MDDIDIREEWMKEFELPYSMKRNEIIKEQLFFDEYPKDIEETEETEKGD